MLPRVLHRAGLRGWMMHSASFGGIGLCILLWQRAKTVDQDERGNAERRALFVGLWPPTMWLIGDALEEAAREPLRRRAALRVPGRRRRAYERLPGL
jgi:hypothetical protein